MNSAYFSPKEQEINNILLLSPHRRYLYFVGKVADWEQVWTLANHDGLVTAQNDDHRLFLPLWAAKEYVELCLTDEWAECYPLPMTLEHLMTEILPDMASANIQTAIMMLPNGKSTPIFDAQSLLDDLQEECQQYE